MKIVMILFIIKYNLNQLCIIKYNLLYTKPGLLIAISNQQPGNLTDPMASKSEIIFYIIPM